LISCAPPILKVDVRAGREIPGGARYEHLAGSRLRGNSSADVHGDADEVLPDDLALAAVQSGPDVEPET
jgi:hypothetical protein